MKVEIFRIIHIIFILGSCSYQDHESLPALSTDQFQLKLKKIKNNFFIVWPMRSDNLMDSETVKLQKLVGVLSKASDAEIEVIPVYNENVNKEKLKNREFLIRDMLCGFGIPLTKIILKNQIIPHRYEEGFAINVIVYQLMVPNCSEFKDGGVKSQEESFRTFKCSTVANFGKLIAYPSSLNKYKRTENNRDSALKALESISQSGG